MSVKARAIKKLYNMGKISADGVRRALEAGVITQAEYDLIIGNQ